MSVKGKGKEVIGNGHGEEHTGWLRDLLRCP